MRQGHGPVHEAKVVIENRYGYVASEHLHRLAVIDARSCISLRQVIGYSKSLSHTRYKYCAANT